MVQLIRTIDAHAGGQPMRLIVEGMPRALGKTLAQKRDWLARHADHFRCAIVREPRGHSDMVAGVFTEAVLPGSHAGLLFMDADGYPAMSGHGVIAAATIALERNLIVSSEGPSGEARLVFDTPAGTIAVRAHVADRGGTRRVDSVWFTNVPAFVHSPSHPARLGGRELRVDVAFGGVFLALVDTESVGIPLESSRLPEFRRLALDILQSLNSGPPITHPSDAKLSGVDGVVFTGPPRDPEAHLRNLTVSGRAVDRSPSGTGTAAIMAVLDAMGLLPDGAPFVNEGLAGSLFRGQAIRRTVVGESPALVAEIEGAAWITGEHTFLLDEDDPYREGIDI